MHTVRVNELTAMGKLMEHAVAFLSIRCQHRDDKRANGKDKRAAYSKVDNNKKSWYE